MITENTYRVPAVQRLLLAAAPFFICVIYIFLFEETEHEEVKRRNIPSMTTAQNSRLLMQQNRTQHEVRADASQPSVEKIPDYWLESLSFDPQLSDPQNNQPQNSQPQNSQPQNNQPQNGEPKLPGQHAIGNHLELAVEAKNKRHSTGLVPFELTTSLAVSALRKSTRTDDHGKPTTEGDRENWILEARDELETPSTFKSSISEALVLPGADRSQQMSITDTDTTAPNERQFDFINASDTHYPESPPHRDSFILQVQATNPGNGSANSSPDASGDPSAEDPEEYGVPPPRRVPLFLQETTVLLEVGEYQYESGLRYSTNANVFPVSAILDGTAFVANATRKQQSIITPLEFRLGVAKELQAFVNLPFGWSKQRITAQSTEQAEDDELGIGDLSFGLTKLLWEWKSEQTRLLGSLSASAPTGPSAFAINSQSDIASLGRGYWTLGGGFNVVHTIDPLAFFGGVGYTQTFPVDAGGGQTLDAGNTLFYSIGLGYAVNPAVSLNTALTGGYSGELTLNDQKLAGTETEPVSLKVAATFANIKKDDKKNKHAHHKYLTATLREPYVRFGLTNSATDVDFGIRVTY